MSNSAKVRIYQQFEKDRLVEIYDSAILESHSFLDSKKRQNNRSLMERSLDNPETEILVLEYDQTIIGFATFISNDRMSGFFIEPKFQGQGLGTRFMQYIQNTRKSIKLAVYKSNKKGISFYKKNGFHQIGNSYGKDGNYKFLEMEWNMKDRVDVSETV